MRDWKKLTASVIFGMTLATVVVSAITWLKGKPSPGYTVVLMNGQFPARAMIRWMSVDRPTVVPGGVEWTDASGRYFMVSGNVYVEQMVEVGAPIAAVPVPAQPAEEAADGE